MSFNFYFSELNKTKNIIINNIIKKFVITIIILEILFPMKNIIILFSFIIIIFISIFMDIRPENKNININNIENIEKNFNKIFRIINSEKKFIVGGIDIFISIEKNIIQNNDFEIINILLFLFIIREEEYL